MSTKTLEIYEQDSDDDWCGCTCIKCASSLAFGKHYHFGKQAFENEALNGSFCKDCAETVKNEVEHAITCSN